MRQYLWLLIGLGALLAYTAGRESAEKDLDALQGAWRFTALEAEGKAVLEEVVLDSRLLITGDRFELITPDAVHAGLIRLDPTHKPKLIDIEYTSGPERGQRALGIYHLGGRGLIVCIGLPERERPVVFGSTPGSGYVLQHLERANPSFGQ